MPIALSSAELKAQVLPALFLDTSKIGEYGAGGSSAATLQSSSDLMGVGAISDLASKIEEIVIKLSDADPQKIAQTPSWLDKLLGRGIERQVRYQVARKELNELIAEAEIDAQIVRDTLHGIEALMARHSQETDQLRIYIQAGREFLEENPTTGVAQDGAVEFDRPRERFARKLTNLATLLASHEMSIMQMKLARAQAVDMLDRFSETTTVLLPVWRQHTMALITTQNMNADLVLEATKAHQALQRSLAQSLSQIEK